MIESFRIVNHRYVDTALNGEGASQYGGRWNSEGTKIVYTASTISLATLELMTHVHNKTILNKLYKIIKLQFNEELVTVLDESELTSNWSSDVITESSKRIGDEWIREGKSLVLKVPSIVTKSEYNYLINPDHISFTKIQISEAFDFNPDKRIFR